VSAIDSLDTNTSPQYSATRTQPASRCGTRRSRQIIERNGGPGGVRTLDLMTARLTMLVYLVDFAARLATQKHAKAWPERSSCTDFVLVRTGNKSNATLREGGTGDKRDAKGRSIVLAVPLQDLEGLAPCLNHRQTRNCGVLASQGLPALLDLDLQKEAPRSPRGHCRDSSLDQEDGRSQPAVGRASPPWQVAEARHRDIGTNRVSTPAQKASTPLLKTGKPFWITT
jgi:hypothetical protein